MKILTPDELMYKCNLYDDNGMAYITALDAYRTLYTQHQALVKFIDHLSGCGVEFQSRFRDDDQHVKLRLKMKDIRKLAALAQEE